ncbi:MAG: hypothetical protein ACREOO_25270 [bacterium]
MSIYSCSSYNPTASNIGNASFLPAPTNMSATTGTVFVDLAWQFNDVSRVKEFRVYRRGQRTPTFSRIASTKALQYRDNLVASDSVYFYRVAAVGSANLEGAPSEIISATPGIYSLKLSGGSKYTNRRSVLIAISAPQNTALMLIANDSSFTNASWESFATQRAWDLTLGDGRKIVYAKFRSAAGQETSKPVQAEIILDSVAGIKFVQENSQGRNLKPGERLHLSLNAGEAQGNATADLVDLSNTTSGRVLGIRLYDDGTNGDQTSADGIYETDYLIGPGLEVLNAYVYGHFTDVAGNVAPTATASGRVTIQLPPTAVILYEPTTLVNDATALSLRWTRNSDTDFFSYQIRRSRDAVVSLSSVLVREFNSVQSTTHTDTNLDPGTRYYYRLYVFDTAGNSTGSNIVQATTPANESPQPVSLSQPVSDPAATALTLTWSSSAETDFGSYRLYRSGSSPVDTTSAPVTVINSAGTTQYRDASVLANTTYYYRVFVYDKYGLSAGSNEVQGRP